MIVLSTIVTPKLRIRLSHPFGAVRDRQTTSAADDPVGQLERLADLFERGLLTQEEFTAAKSRLISGPPET